MSYPKEHHDWLSLRQRNAVKSQVTFLISLTSVIGLSSDRSIQLVSSGSITRPDWASNLISYVFELVWTDWFLMKSVTQGLHLTQLLHFGTSFILVHTRFFIYRCFLSHVVFHTLHDFLCCCTPQAFHILHDTTLHFKLKLIQI